MLCVFLSRGLKLQRKRGKFLPDLKFLTILYFRLWKTLTQQRLPIDNIQQDFAKFLETNPDATWKTYYKYIIVHFPLNPSHQTRKTVSSWFMQIVILSIKNISMKLWTNSTVVFLAQLKSLTVTFFFPSPLIFPLVTSEWTLTIDELCKYTGILLWSFNTFFGKAKDLGDLISDYVDRGGGVVMMCYG